MKGLMGMTVGLLESRWADALAQLVRRHGGIPRCAPAVTEQRTADAADQVVRLLDAFETEPSPVVVFSTGYGVASLFELAAESDRQAQLREVLGAATTACRGPKPVAALHREGVSATVRAAPPYTSAELLDELRRVDLAGRLVALVHHGEPARELAQGLAERGARLVELLLYEWRPPTDARPLVDLARAIAAGEVGAVAFTSGVQVRHLVEAARGVGLEAPLVAGLRERTLVGAMGPVCARALQSLGIAPDAVPERPTMAALVAALAERAATGGAR
ncbi:MAG: uroporphyrinogen-III synthase [Myxococcales bacterium]